MKNRYEIEITLNHEFEILYHSFDKLENLSKEIDWIMNLEIPISLNLIESIRIYKL